jgi:hypothetical protein
VTRPAPVRNSGLVTYARGGPSRCISKIYNCVI